MPTPKIVSEMSVNTLSVLFVKRKQIFLGRILYITLGVFVFYFRVQISGFDILFILFFAGLIGVFLSMKKPFSFLHNISLPLFFVSYLSLPIAISKAGSLFVLCGFLVAMHLFLKNKKRLNSWVQIALLAPTTIFIVWTFFY